MEDITRRLSYEAARRQGALPEALEELQRRLGAGRLAGGSRTCVALAKSAVGEGRPRLKPSG